MGGRPYSKALSPPLRFPLPKLSYLQQFFAARQTKKLPINLLGGLLTGAGIILAVTIRNLLVLGATLKQHPYFPSYIAVGRIRIGDFLQRMEITVAIVFVVGAFIKISVCLLAASTGVKKLAGLNHYRPVVMPIGILMILLANGIYKNTVEMVKWAFDIYSYYALPFQLFIPILLLGVALISKHKEKKANAQPSS